MCRRETPCRLALPGFERSVRVNRMKVILLVVLCFAVAVVVGCSQSTERAMNLSDIDYSIYGPLETDINY